MKSRLLLSIALLGLPGVSAAATYTGSWHNTTFGSFGAVLFEIALSPPDVTVSADFDGGVFGAGDPPPLVLSGTLDSGGTATVATTDDPFFGDVSGSISALGSVGVTITDLPLSGPTPTGLSIFSTALDGTFDGIDLALNYLVLFNCGGLTPTACPGPGAGVEGSHFALGSISATLVPLPGTVLFLAPAVVALLGIRRRTSYDARTRRK